jgi:hypothetical protein
MKFDPFLLPACFWCVAVGLNLKVLTARKSFYYYCNWKLILILLYIGRKNNIMERTLPLQDISNKVHLTKKRLHDGTVKTYTCARKIRKSMDVTFTSERDKQAFDAKLTKAKAKLGCNSNVALLSQLLDLAIEDKPSPPSPSLHLSSGGHDNFICAKDKLFELVAVMQNNPYEIVGYEQVGHVVIVTLMHTAHHTFHRWSSSAPLKGDYLINYRMLHAYLCSGIRAVQYERLSDFAGIGISTSYFRRNIIPIYGQAVERVKNRSMTAALDLEITSSTEKGLRIATDARHACRKNSYHTDVVVIGDATHRVVHYGHVTKAEEACSQKHEVFGSRKMYESFNQRGIKVCSFFLPYSAMI